MRGRWPSSPLSGISIIEPGPPDNIHLSTDERNCGSSLQCTVLSRAGEGAIRASRENPEDSNRPSFDPCFRHFAAPLTLSLLKSNDQRLNTVPLCL
jgi:hypothetical protein